MRPKQIRQWLVAWVLPLLENKGQDKRVESILVPCLDAGSNPAISTSLGDYEEIPPLPQKKQKNHPTTWMIFLWSHLGLNHGPPDYESGATNQLSYRTSSSTKLMKYGLVLDHLLRSKLPRQKSNTVQRYNYFLK